MLILLIFIFGCCHLGQAACGYESCPIGKEGYLNVHLVPHTHDDVGWLVTVDEYYYNQVQYILDSVVTSLLQDPKRKFIYVETAFFWRWWQEQSDATQHQVRALVNEGRLEFINGGWSMNDEAATHYTAIINNMAWGLRRLNDTFGECGRPRVAWQIDPFGHSREQASLIARMGYDGLFWGRLDYADRDKRKAELGMEFVWQASANLGKSSWLFTGALENSYNPPDGFMFDIFNDPQPFKDDHRLVGYNVQERVADFIKAAKSQEEHYQTRNIMMTMGTDFTYTAAHVWYKNMDKLIKYVNAAQINGSDVNVLYSTPSCYVKALHDANQGWTSYTEDFFPYASDPHAYWTGYFTSRPALKYYARKSNALLMASEQMSSLSQLPYQSSGDLVEMREVLGVLQHHDAVSGTSKQAVAEDYAQRLARANNIGYGILKTGINKLMAVNSSSPELDWSSCAELNTSSCAFTEGASTFIISVYNPQSRQQDLLIRFPVQPGFTYRIYDPQGSEVQVELFNIPPWILSLPGRTSSAKYEAVFTSLATPSLGYVNYYVQRLKGKPKYTQLRKGSQINNKEIGVSVNNITGLLESISYGGQMLGVSQGFGYYAGMNGDNSKFENRASGAYIFRPNGTKPTYSNKARTLIAKGAAVSEIHQEFSEFVHQTIRVYPNQPYVEFDWTVGPIPIQDGVGKEVISIFETSINSTTDFYTDSNGREIMKRVRDGRPSWKLNVTEPVSGNYYPVDSLMFIKDDNVQLTLLNDRAQGGSGMRSGQMEIMVHRRLLHDDASGAGEALNETAFGVGLVVRGKHYLVLSKPSDAAAIYRPLAQRILHQPQLMFANTQLTLKQWTTAYRNQLSGLSKSFPANVQVLTLSPWRSGLHLLRLEHFYEVKEDKVLSQPAKLHLLQKGLFHSRSVGSVVGETVLSGHQWSRDVKRLLWYAEAPLFPASKLIQDVDNDTIVINPFQIRTFVVKLV